MSIIIILMLFILGLIFFWGKAKMILIALLIFLAIALWLEGFNYDIDLQKYWETGSYSESRVETVTDDDGNSIRLITGDCNRSEYDFNCDDFQMQAEAQTKYQVCADEIAADNPGIDVQKLDIYGLDRDKDGIVCEALPAN